MGSLIIKHHYRSIQITTPQDHIYALSNKNLFRKLDEIRGNRSKRDAKKNCAYHKDIEHSTVNYNALRNEIEILIWVGHFKEFLEDEPQVITINERPK